ncbi:DUF362 domain-containing protein [bacterium]|nr:DUF362 domain-containing protein [bacterium]
MDTNSTVVITEAPQGDYLVDYVALPDNYGSKAYYDRQDIRNIDRTVIQNLEELDRRIDFTGSIKDKRIIIKPNLVSVFHKIGFKDENYPESTDPRVFESIIRYLLNYTDDIVIVEGSGRGMPTHASFKISGIDRVAKRFHLQLLAVEEQPIDRYILPKAKVMKEIYIPRIFSEVVRGEAFYISVPKMKTNLYTGVTLGFKNAMGTIPYNLRQKNHSYQINNKLVDILYLFKPDLVIIDGIIGGEGDTPAPVDPVRSHVLISGNNSVETDTVATRMMGIDPETIELLTDAVSRGFGDEKVIIVGREKVTPFRKADQTLLSDQFYRKFPNVTFLVGHTNSRAPKFDSIEKVMPDDVKAIEGSCIGGCIAALRQSFEMFYYQGLKTDFALMVILGNGTEIDGISYYFDRNGRAYTVDEIKRSPLKKMVFGSCTSTLAGFGNTYSAGCMPKPIDGLNSLHKLTGTWNRIFSLKNKQLAKIAFSALKMRKKRIKLVKSGIRVDMRPSYWDDSLSLIPHLSDEDSRKDFIEWPMPKLEGEEKKAILADVRKNSF